MPQTGGAIKVKKTKPAPSPPSPPKPVRDPHGQNRRPDANAGSANPAGRTADRPRSTPSGDSKEKAVRTERRIKNRVQGIGGSDNVVQGGRNEKVGRPSKQQRDRDRAGQTDFQKAKQRKITDGFKTGGGGATSDGITRLGGPRVGPREGPGGGFAGPGIEDGFKRSDLVGSQNHIVEFDGTEYGTGGTGVGGGGTGAAVPGLASVASKTGADFRNKDVEEFIGRGAKKTKRTGQKRTQ